MKTRLRRLLIILAVGCAHPAPAEPASALAPAHGVPAQALAPFDKLMQDFMSEHEISAGQLAVMHDSIVVFNRSYGWQDRERTKPLPADALMRVASVTKPFTAAAIRKLVAQGKLSTDNHVFNLGQAGGGILELAPFGTPDPHLKDITIEHCLRHRGGWDRALVGDLTYFELKAAQEMGIESPPGRTNIVRYIMGQPLQNDPGAKEVYSNIGYLLLGLVIEKLSGKDYLTFLHEEVTRPAGIADADLKLGRSFWADADPREPWYDDPQPAPNVFYPAHSEQQSVEAPYGSFDMEARTSQGRLITNSRSLVLFLDKFMVNGDDIGKRRRAPGTWQFNYSGKQRGTEALARARGDGINYAVIFNKASQSGQSYSAGIRQALDKLIDSGAIATWPETFYFPPATGDWERVPPGTVGWNEEKLNAALKLAGDTRASGVVILYRGKILAEQYWKLDENTRAGGKAREYGALVRGRDASGHVIEDVASAQKSIAAMLVGIAQHQGLLRLEDPVAKHLGAGWSKASPEQEQAITVRHLLTMTSGLKDDLTFEAVPGTRWRYNSAAYSRAVNVLAAASKKTPNDLTREWLTGRIGMGNSSWVKRVGAGAEAVANPLGFATTARDLARFGLLILAEGRWNGEPVIADHAYLHAALRPSQKLNPSYGYLWWLNGQPEVARGAGARTKGPLIPTAPPDLVAALGAVDRKLYVVPSLELVVTRLGNSTGPAFQNDFWKLLMEAAPVK